MRFGYLILFLFISIKSFAFDFDKCSKEMNRFGPWGFLTTSGQFTTSTGGEYLSAYALSPVVMK